MLYSSLSELESAKQTISYKLQKEAERQEKLEKERQEKIDKKTLEIKMKYVKDEILKSFKTVTLSDFYLTFDMHYGQDYNKDILRDSLSFNLDNDLRPQLSYIPKEFIKKDDEYKMRQKFNQNIQSDMNTSFFYGQVVNQVEQEVQFYGTLQKDIPYSEQENYDEDLKKMSPEDIINLESKQPQVESKYIYEEAYTCALDNFNKYYNKVLKPVLERKYQIKL